MSDPSPLAETDAPAGSPRSYLGWSLAATVLCFLPIGLVALWFGLRTQQALADGRGGDAIHLSHVARGWLVATIVVGVLLWVALAVAALLLGAFSP